jgi:hypothetical protein
MEGGVKPLSSEYKDELSEGKAKTSYEDKGGKVIPEVFWASS